MATEMQIEANRRNAQKSSGPRTEAGKERSQLNAIKHGLTAATVVVPGEDPDVLEARVDAWKRDVRPGGSMQEYLVERAAHASWQLDRADRTIAARVSAVMRRKPRKTVEREADEVADLARRLFWDARDPLTFYPHEKNSFGRIRISRSIDPRDLDDPARLVNRLESFEAGCRWLIDQWRNLRKILDFDQKWQAPDRFRAVRLLGRQPLDALDDEGVLSIYLGCRAMDPEGPSLFADLGSEMNSVEARILSRRVSGRDVEDRLPDGPVAGRELLLAIVESAIARIEELLAVHTGHKADDRPGRDAASAFEASEEGERLRRYQQACARTFFRSVSVLLKARKDLDDQSNAPGDDLDEATPSAEAHVDDETNPISAAGPETESSPTPPPTTTTPEVLPSELLPSPIARETETGSGAERRCLSPFPEPPSADVAIIDDETNPISAAGPETESSPTPPPTTTAAQNLPSDLLPSPIAQETGTGSGAQRRYLSPFPEPSGDGPDFTGLFPSPIARETGTGSGAQRRCLSPFPEPSGDGPESIGPSRDGPDFTGPSDTDLADPSEAKWSDESRTGTGRGRPDLTPFAPTRGKRSASEASRAGTGRGRARPGSFDRDKVKSSTSEDRRAGTGRPRPASVALDPTRGEAPAIEDDPARSGTDHGEPIKPGRSNSRVRIGPSLATLEAIARGLKSR